MSLTNGSINLTRYRLLDPPDELTNDFIIERLKKNSFVNIDHTLDESSLGWVEILNPLQTEFDPASFRFGGFIALTLRRDVRKVSPKTIARYYVVREAEYAEKTGRRPNSLAKKELREAVKLELLQKAPVDTGLMEVVWLQAANEIWLDAVGESKREVFEELWSRTFGLSLQMLVPITMGLEMTPEANRQALLETTPAAIWGDLALDMGQEAINESE